MIVVFPSGSVAAPRLLAAVLILAALCGCNQQPTYPRYDAPRNNFPVIDGLIARPDSIGPSDSTVVFCSASDADGDPLVYDWETDGRLDIQGTPTWNKYLNNTRTPFHTFYNANLRNPINDSAWVYCRVRDTRGGGVGRSVFIVLRP